MAASAATEYTYGFNHRARSRADLLVTHSS